MGSYYVLRSLAQTRPQLSRRLPGARDRLSESTHIVTEHVEKNDGSLEAVESVPFPESWRGLRFHALVVFGVFGGVACSVRLCWR
ncbi:MAG: hypothetical protein OXG65_16780 [Chloroflexi bacterium]|nr:hypothetical protein [Chloroflexota bacterium]